MSLGTAFLIALLLGGVPVGQDAMGGAAKSGKSEEKIRFQDLPDVVKSAVRENGKEMRILGISKNDEGGRITYEVELKGKAGTRDLTLDATGRLVEMEDEVPFSALTPAARAAVERQAEGGKILRCEIVARDGVVLHYEVDIKVGGRKKTEIKVTPDGKDVP